VLECVINISEGRDPEVVAAIAATAGPDLLDVHTDADHNRSVLTVVGEDAPRAVARAAVERLDLRHHVGAHPRIGVLDVVPFVPLGDTSMGAAIAARDEFAVWAAEALGLPCFLYGPERSLPDVRRGAFLTLGPDVGPSSPHPSAGAAAVGARRVLVAYNLWLAEPDLDAARRIASDIRGDGVRALGLTVGDDVQVSMNLVDPTRVGPAEVWDLVAAHAPIARAELVGLVPRAVLDAAPAERWAQLDLGPDRTIEARLAGRDRRSHSSGSDGGAEPRRSRDSG
jgi:glutamate formiminotransferase / 5-formyltetrahydrofolate cyclo-ligase